MSFEPEDFDFVTDPTVSTFSICDYETFRGDTLKEKYECIYIKIVEMRNVLTCKAEAKGLEVGEFTIRAGEFFADLVETSRTGLPVDRSGDLPFIGELPTDECKVFLDKNLHRNKILVECKAGKGILIINNIPQLEGKSVKP